MTLLEITCLTGYIELAFHSKGYLYCVKNYIYIRMPMPMPMPMPMLRCRCRDFQMAILEEDRREIVIIHIGSNDITYNTIDNIDAKSISKRIIDIGMKYLLYG